MEYEAISAHITAPSMHKMDDKHYAARPGRTYRGPDVGLQKYGKPGRPLLEEWISLPRLRGEH